MLQASARMLPPSTLLANVTGTVHQNPAARSGADAVHSAMQSHRSG
ncbi:MAG: hypothetical protein R2873_25985 [Caldilineaceae bacterium]